MAVKQLTIICTQGTSTSLSVYILGAHTVIPWWLWGHVPGNATFNKCNK